MLRKLTSWGMPPHYELNRELDGFRNSNEEKVSEENQIPVFQPKLLTEVCHFIKF
jgi:hypothetical protein